MVIAHHIILTGYGHWLPNDARGSMSREVRSERLEDIGPLHHGRRPVQPTGEALRAFHRAAGPVLHYPLLWWNGVARQAMIDAFGDVVKREGLTCYACAVLRNHVHLLVRKHRWRAEQTSAAMKTTGRERLIGLASAPAGHPVFSADCCHIYKSTAEEVRTCVDYIWGNYKKHRLAPALAPWVVEYDGWPLRP
jgi:hypothetical protein